ncbi:UDP-3-O-(3-hydroxymyristoyl)glucosamine N-acyltransferase [Paramagnetospirillum marisnigri]|uniref:UDP-3-O-acylglucosamine N-acyltransferase n=1 Tax=Paramagnetospirillum marisnigri TaxID=1285242 RepID=A0A178M6V8_9PROT|nr:UDP-3-O-(3-hydroxymyristoyl)glucosamine N-acyltransferase [Paramagnetospirillum marisnigri]OAN43957.1 UDP-3-O-(3-hydroxymyristoyl)glucosamine N-acyltransferase [Paramagnetospirillum marisnigri]
MADPRFFTVAGPYTLASLADIAKASVSDGADMARIFKDVAPLEVAGPDEVSFLDNKKYVAAFQASKAGLCVVSPEMADKAPPGMTLLLAKDPYRAYARIAQAFYPVAAPEPWIAPTACIDSTAKVAPSCRVEPGAVIGAGAEIGERSHVGPNVVIGRGVIIGEDCILGANATVSHAVIGHKVNIYPGARIGQDGFGFAMGAEGHLKVPQLGRVVIGNGVEIGANTTIDRGAGPDTVIGDGCMIDNLVQIGHNVQLGRGCVIVAQVGISGSTRMGDFAAAGGQAGITGHLRIGAGARIAAQAGVMRDVGPGETVGGAPAVPMTEWLRQTAMIGKMARKKG